MMFWNKLSLYPYTDIESESGDCHFYIGIQRNVSHVIQQDEKIKYLHFHDINTALYNYLGFYEISNERIDKQRGQSQEKFVCVAICKVFFTSKRGELSEFEIDRILRHMAMEFRLHFFAEDVIAKLNGHQFAFTLFAASDDVSWILSKMKTIEDRVNAILTFPCKVRLKSSMAFENIFQPVYLDQLISKASSVIDII
jgi:GGDEF domain-containing protein